METFGESGADLSPGCRAKLEAFPAAARLGSSPQRDKKYDKSTCFSAFIFGAERNWTANAGATQVRHLGNRHSRAVCVGDKTWMNEPNLGAWLTRFSVDKCPPPNTPTLDLFL